MSLLRRGGFVRVIEAVGVGEGGNRDPEAIPKRFRSDSGAIPERVQNVGAPSEASKAGQARDVGGGKARSGEETSRCECLVSPGR